MLQTSAFSTGLRAWFDYVPARRRDVQLFRGRALGLLRAESHRHRIPAAASTAKGPAKASNFQEPYLRQLLSFMGLTDIAFNTRREDRFRTGRA